VTDTATDWADDLIDMLRSSEVEDAARRAVITIRLPVPDVRPVVAISWA
jgi:hypothetical protein